MTSQDYLASMIWPHGKPSPKAKIQMTTEAFERQIQLAFVKGALSVTDKLNCHVPEMPEFMRPFFGSKK